MNTRANAPAFPSFGGTGVTIRELAAMVAMGGLLAGDTDGLAYEDAARFALKHADALLAALTESRKEPQ